MKNFFYTILLILIGCSKQVPQKEIIINDKDLLTPEKVFNKISRLNDAEIIAARRNGGKDADRDGVPDNIDNCRFVFNPFQEDNDNDGIGNACDPFTDTDNDGVIDADDNCRTTYNPNQLDCNGNSIGDACDNTTCTNTGNQYVLFLDFDGHFITETYWIPFNNGQPFSVGNSGLSETEIAEIVQIVKNDYAAFKLTVTTDSALYQAAPFGKRQRVIITQDHEWYGAAGGVAHVGSMFFTSPQPCFVFSKALYYYPFYIGGATSHEAGHTAGLYHQINVDLTTCAFISSYRPNLIMGNPYNTPQRSWAVGLGGKYLTGGVCGYITQDDLKVMNIKIPFIN